MYSKFRRYIKENVIPEEVETMTVQSCSQSFNVSYKNQPADFDDSPETMKSSSQTTIASPLSKMLFNSRQADPMVKMKSEMSRMEKISRTIMNWYKRKEEFVNNFATQMEFLNLTFSESTVAKPSFVPDFSQKKTTKQLRQRKKCLFEEELKSVSVTTPRKCLTPPSFGNKRAKLDPSYNLHTQCRESFIKDPKHFEIFGIDFMIGDGSYKVNLNKASLLYEGSIMKLYTGLVRHSDDSMKQAMIVRRENQNVCVQFLDDNQIVATIGSIRGANGDEKGVEQVLKELVDEMKVEVFSIDSLPFETDVNLLPLKRSIF